MKPRGVPSRTRHRIITYLTVGVGLSVSYFLLRGTTWSGSMQLHTLMEAVATLLALTVGMLSLVRYYSKRETMFLIIGVGFLVPGCWTAQVSRYAPSARIPIYRIASKPRAGLRSLHI